MSITLNAVEFKFPSGMIGKIRGMTAGEQNMFADKKKFKQEGLDGLLKKCIVEPTDLNLKEMLIGDKFFAIFQIRRLTYGDKYSFRTICPFCDEPGKYYVNLDEFKTRYLENRKVEGIEPDQIEKIPFELPFTKKKVLFRLLKGKDEKYQQEIAKKKSDKILTSTLMLHVQEIEGEDMVTEEFFESIPAYDAQALRDFIDECDCGIETEITVTCNECDADFELDLPLTSDFFFPKKIGKASKTF